MSKVLNVFLRVLVFVTIALSVYVFVNSGNVINKNNLQSDVNMSFYKKYDVFFINPGKDSTFVMATFSKENDIIIINGRIKSYATKKINLFDVEISYFSEENKQVGKESLTIQKECAPKSFIEFRKEGMTIPDETKEIRMKIN